MVGCSAPFCSNSSEKGFIMKKFPKDVLRRAAWTKNLNRPNWTPTDNCCLCEVHFPIDMWEQKRMDKKRKLKFNAVPTIFGYYIKEKPVFPIIEDKKVLPLSTNQAVSYKLALYDHDYIGSVLLNARDPLNTNGPLKINNDMIEYEDDEIGINLNTEKIGTDNDRVTRLLKENQKLRNHMQQMRKQIKCLRYKTNVLQEKLSKDKYRNILRKIFNEDQISSLINKKQRQWSADTIQKALRLKASCGNNGYNDLLRQGMPLPTTRTLQRSLSKMNAQPGNICCLSYQGNDANLDNNCL